MILVNIYLHFSKSTECTTLSSVQFSHSVVSESLRPHESQHARPPCPSPAAGVHSELASIKSVMPSSHLILGRPLLLMNFALIGKKGDYSAIQHHNNLFQSLCSKTTCNGIIFKMIYNRAEKKRPHGVKHMTSLLLIGDRIHFFLISRGIHNSKYQSYLEMD